MGKDFCSGCGYSLIGRAHSHFCPACGKKLESDVFDVSNVAPQKITLVSALITMFKKYVDFKGRARRKEYWLAYLANAIISWVIVLIATMCLGFGEGSSSQDFMYVIACLLYLVYYLYILAAFVPLIALTVRRLHDIGKSGWWYFISFVPCGIGLIVILIFMSTDSQSGPNKYGNNPKENYIL